MDNPLPSGPQICSRSAAPASSCCFRRGLCPPAGLRPASRKQKTCTARHQEIRQMRGTGRDHHLDEDVRTSGKKVVNVLTSDEAAGPPALSFRGAHSVRHLRSRQSLTCCNKTAIFFQPAPPCLGHERSGSRCLRRGQCAEFRPRSLSSGQPVARGAHLVRLPSAIGHAPGAARISVDRDDIAPGLLGPPPGCLF
jgi:hypothetical protein